MRVDIYLSKPYCGFHQRRHTISSAVLDSIAIMKVKTKITARLSFIIEMPSFWIWHFKRKENRTERKEREVKQKRREVEKERVKNKTNLKQRKKYWLINKISRKIQKSRNSKIEYLRDDISTLLNEILYQINRWIINAGGCRMSNYRILIRMSLQVDMKISTWSRCVVTGNHNWRLYYAYIRYCICFYSSFVYEASLKC